ncbi:HAMP domain-containing histidine kinase [Mediterraneibacter sp. NSJ-55]|uniref:histidine kinase n=1 Tax=Mediterraneibacter hominis TaxID=2763054 RepID=A0A923RQ77_9FIRM|nr:HAMP domain-containing sensor histidine kinase [Mediterraneibacter hominis]MBC5689220.1 HAMP domain-containing histidine kinase [Mediterraneibacter hominis]
MLHNIDINKMNQLMEENKDAKQIISQLLENHHTTVSTIAHEIRNPLTLVSSSLQVMEIQHPEVKQYSHWKQTMEDVEFMCSLLNELSTFNNGSTLHHSVFSIEKLLKNIAVSFAISLDSEDSSIEFSSSIPSRLGSYTGDKVKLEEVVLNLLRNAKDAVDENGTITLSADRKKDMLIILCKDNGCGIPADKIDTIFTPFVTSKEDGTGLGLSLSKRIIEAHNGTISVDSIPTKGTTFTIKLPI